MYQFIIGVMVGAFILIQVGIQFPEYTVLYKDGQLDCVNGKVLFELKKNEIGESVWVRKHELPKS